MEREEKMNNDEISKALIDVRKAYRLVYLYTASILDAVQRISQEFNCRFYVWTPTYYSNSPTIITSPFPPSRWAWDMIPFYNTSFLFLSEGADRNTQNKGDWMLEISIETDSSATDKFSEECEEEPNPLSFEPPEKAESNLYLLFYYCTQPNEFDWYHHFWKNKRNKNVDYPDEEVGVIKEYGLKYISQTYELSKLFTEKTLLECVADFKNLIKAKLPEIKNL
jgi:hypothetical protein